MKPAPPLLLALMTSLLVLSSCNTVTSSGMASSTAYLSSTPGAPEHVTLRHYPVARQGKLTAWLTSSHRMSSGEFLNNPADANIRHRIVGRIRASDMKGAAKHDGAFLLTDDYTGPVYPLWEGVEGKGLLYAGIRKGWIPVNLRQPLGGDMWVTTRPSNPIGPWSSFPIVIGDPAKPESIAGAMWSRSNANRHLGAATSPRMLKGWLDRLDFKQFVN